MTLDSTAVRVAVTGAVYVGPTTTPAPTSHDSVLNAGFTDLGYVNEDGVTETRDRSTNTIKGWQNGAILREVVTEASVTYGLKLVETNADTVGLYYGTTVDGDGGEVIIVPSNTGGRQSFVIDAEDGDDVIRAYVPNGEVVEVGEQVYQNGEAIGYEVTIRAYPDASIPDADGNDGSVVKWYSTLDTTS